MSTKTETKAKHTAGLAAAHTPGPWHLENTSKHAFSGGMPKIVAECGHHIASITWNGHNERNGDANARLIAAAPELLGALETLINCHTGAPWQTEAVRRAAWLKVQAAIAKATGEEGRLAPQAPHEAIVNDGTPSGSESA